MPAAREPTQAELQAAYASLRSASAPRSYTAAMLQQPWRIAIRAIAINNRRRPQPFDVRRAAANDLDDA